MPSGASPDVAFKVVVIGASAGGIQALSCILSALPCDFGAAIAVVQHREPQPSSMFETLIGRRTALTVRQAEEGDQLEPGMG